MVNLALQGGGAHGAFTWGVLDRLLEDGRIGVEGLVGTSAGAMNATVTAYGLAVGGNDSAREALARFWRGVSDASLFTLLQPTPFDKVLSAGNLDFSPGFAVFDALTRLFSPYQFNPLNYNPLREVLESVVDFERLRCSEVKLFTCATNVLTGRIRVFNCAEVSPNTVLASGCLPFLFQAVEVNGEYYWDGGYMGNPPLFPLIYNCGSRDVLLVMINPIAIESVPHTATEIMDRVNEISFNSSLMREMRAIHFVTSLIDKGHNDEGRLKRMLIHTIDAEDEMRDLNVSSKLNPSWEFLVWLRDLGRDYAGRFLDAHYDKVGRESSTDIVKRFL